VINLTTSARSFSDSQNVDDYSYYEYSKTMVIEDTWIVGDFACDGVDSVGRLGRQRSV
jgi:hypothetical protein